jgi:NAD(P)-dependent dehydrogenase (short-subunit alcohol dehydrogenase family)
VTARRHLVLGGSEGIGFAYAMHQARKGDCLTVVARRQWRLEEARSALLDAGASVVATVAGDLLDRAFRIRLWEDPGLYNSILASGPSPPEGSLKDILTADSERLVFLGYQAALAYPLEVMQRALGGGLQSLGTLHLVGSSASREPLLSATFFLSASFRRIVDEVAQEFAPRFEEQRKRLLVWRPRIVLSPLSVGYARRKAGRKAGKEVNEEDRALLEKWFCISSVPTCEEYVQEQMRHGDDDG